MNAENIERKEMNQTQDGNQGRKREQTQRRHGPHIYFACWMPALFYWVFLFCLVLLGLFCVVRETGKSPVVQVKITQEQKRPDMLTPCFL